MSWSIFGNQNKFQKRNASGYKIFDELFADFFRIHFGKTTVQWLEQYWSVYEDDYMKTRKSISDGLDYKAVGFNVSVQLNNYIYSQCATIDKSKNDKYYSMMGQGLAVSHLAKMIFGWCPAISDSAGISSSSVLMVMIQSSVSLISRASITEDEKLEHLVQALNGGYKDMMNAVLARVESTS
jgi:hypothetical protein